jgi:hypothetical protein
MKPNIGQIVIYKLTEHDKQALSLYGSPHPNNGASVAPAIIVRVWTDTSVNLKVLCDDLHNLWITSSEHGEQEHQWLWPKDLNSGPAVLLG